MKNDDAFQEVKDTPFLVLLGAQEEKVLVFSLVRTLSASQLLEITGVKRDFVLLFTWQAARYLGFRFQIDTEATS